MEVLVDNKIEELISNNDIAPVWNEDVLRPKAYIDTWRIALMDKAFLDVYAGRGTQKFIKSTELSTLTATPLLVKRVVYRFVFVKHSTASY